MYTVEHQIFEAHNFRRSCNLKRFAETIFADQGNPVSHALYLCLFAVPDQSVKNAKIMRLENFALYGIHVHIHDHTCTCIHVHVHVLYICIHVHVT